MHHKTSAAVIQETDNSEKKQKKNPDKYHNYGGQSHQEIAEDLGISTSMSHHIEYEACLKLCRGLIGKGGAWNDVFVEKYGRQPTKNDFIEISKSTWFRSALADLLKG